MWEQLANRLSHHLPRTDEFEDSGAAVMAALAFAVEVLKYPFEMLCQPSAASMHVVLVADAAATARADAAVGVLHHDGENVAAGVAHGTQVGSPDGLFRGHRGVSVPAADGDSPQCSRTATPPKPVQGSADRQSSPTSSRKAAVDSAGPATHCDVEVLKDCGLAWKALYKALQEVSIVSHRLALPRILWHRSTKKHHGLSDLGLFPATLWSLDLQVLS